MICAVKLEILVRKSMSIKKSYVDYYVLSIV